MKTKEEKLKILEALGANQKSEWHKEAKWRAENKDWLKKSQLIAVKILRQLRAKNMTQKDLAEMLNVKPQQVNKWVKGKENFKLETICKIENALNISLVDVILEKNRERVMYNIPRQAIRSKNPILTNRNVYSKTASMKYKVTSKTN